MAQNKENLSRRTSSERQPLQRSLLAPRLNDIISENIFSEDNLHSLYVDWQKNMPEPIDYGMDTAQYQIHCEQLFSATLLIYHLLRKNRGYVTDLTTAAIDNNGRQAYNLSQGIHKKLLDILGQLPAGFNVKSTTLEDFERVIPEYTQFVQDRREKSINIYRHEQLNNAEEIIEEYRDKLSTAKKIREQILIGMHNGYKNILCDEKMLLALHTLSRGYIDLNNIDAGKLNRLIENIEIYQKRNYGSHAKPISKCIHVLQTNKAIIEDLPFQARQLIKEKSSEIVNAIHESIKKYPDINAIDIIGVASSGTLCASLFYEGRKNEINNVCYGNSSFSIAIPGTSIDELGVYHDAERFIMGGHTLVIVIDDLVNFDTGGRFEVRSISSVADAVNNELEHHGLSCIDRGPISDGEFPYIPMIFK